ncbi:MAG: protein-disulfide reductase DsbD family protein [Xanthobacteraceae bacterium]|nr:protein-disulfide reductase DsbD family protein [Xanthobacteraceae bacterium]
MARFVPNVAPRAGRMIAGAALYLCVAGGAHSAALAQTPGDAGAAWITDLHSAVALVGGARHDGVLLDGLVIRLDPGWKTYWRTPGDSGVPPRLDFSGSDNVATVTVLWPAPKAFPDGAGGTSFGYKDEVVLPLRIVAKQPDSPVTLRAQINYAVCDKLCLPVEARTELTSATPAAPGNPAVDAALAHVPQPASIGGSEGFGIRAVKRDGKIVTVEVAAPRGGTVDLFVEGPTPEWALPAPTLRDTAPDGLRRFSFELDGLPPDARPEGATLKLTLAGGGRAYEYDATLD